MKRLIGYLKYLPLTVNSILLANMLVFIAYCMLGGHSLDWKHFWWNYLEPWGIPLFLPAVIIVFVKVKIWLRVATILSYAAIIFASYVFSDCFQYA